ncbi:MAG: DUF2723 domain-containing protein [Chloroflexi bacterium]|nr:DUF2723 domain-containing protein [Chloroflexota bacterium]
MNLFALIGRASSSSNLLGAGLGLYTSRVLLESVSEARPPLWTFAVVLALLGAGLFIARWARDRIDLRPLAFLWAYILYPQIHPGLAEVAAILSILAFAIVHLELKPSQRLVDLALFSVGATLYIHTLSPTVLPADSGEFQFVPYILGIAHPPGYPLYTMLAKLFTFIPLGEVAYRVNLLSALIGALTLVFVSRATRLASGSALAGLIAALVLGGSTTFWAQATTANIRIFTALLGATILYALIGYQRQPSQRALVSCAAALGLGIGHHLSLLLMIPPALAYLWLVDRPLLVPSRAWLRPLGALALSLAPLVYIPLRAASAPFGGEGLLSSPSALLTHLLGLGFQGDLFYFATTEFLPMRLAILGNILEMQFGLPLLMAAALGILTMLRSDPRLAMLLLGSFALIGLTSITYRAPQTVEYLLPAYLPVGMAIGYLVAEWRRAFQDAALRAVGPAILSVLGIALFAQNYPSYLTLSSDRSAREYAERIFTQAPPNSVVLSNWHWATPMWYLQRVEGRRPDLHIVYVYPEGSTPIEESWRRRLEENIARGPVIATNDYPSFAQLPYRTRAVGEAFLIYTEPSQEMPSGFRSLDAVFGDRIRLIGYRLERERGAPGEGIELSLAWQPATRLERDYSFFVHLVGKGGQLLGQMDLTHPVARNYRPGEVLVDSYRLPLLPSVPPGRYQLIAGTYFTDAEGWHRLTTPDGADSIRLGRIEVLPASSSRISLHPLRVPFANGLALVAVDFDNSVSGARRVYLHWQVERPLADELQIALYAASGGEVARVPLQLGGAPVGARLLSALDLPHQTWPLQLELRDKRDRRIPSLGPWGLPLDLRVDLPSAHGDGRYIDLGGEMLLVGAEVPSRPLRPGQEVTIPLHFLAPRPLTADYVISLSLVDAEGRRWALADSPPAAGAIPTLKWIRGTQVTDPHALAIPFDAPAGALQLHLLVYDGFTLRALSILDERLARLGITVPLGQVNIAGP